MVFVWRFVFLPGLYHLPSRLAGVGGGGTLSLGWLNRLLSNTCAVNQVAQDLGVGADALGLINIKRFRTVPSSR